MTDAIKAAIEQLETESARIDRALAALRELSPNGQRTSASQKANGSSDGAAAPPSDTGDLTIAEAVDRVLTDADQPITINEIRRKSEAEGRFLNLNSVRWCLGNAVNAGTYRKTKDGRRNLYKKR